MKNTVLALTLTLLTFLGKLDFARALPEAKMIRIFAKNGAPIAVHEYRPEGATQGDILYLHGLGDRTRNHQALFEKLTSRGYRVISPDLPQHGNSKIEFNLSSGISIHNAVAYLARLDQFTFEDLEDIAIRTENRTVEDRKRPLFLAGFSLGAVLIIDLAANETRFAGLTRRPSGFMLLSPSMFPGPVINIRAQDVTKRKELYAPAEFPSILHCPIFTKHFVEMAEKVAKHRLPSDIPTWVATGDDYIGWRDLVGTLGAPVDRHFDMYTYAQQTHEWGKKQKKNGAQIVQTKCEKALHGLDNEEEPIGEETRSQAFQFVDLITKGWPASYLPSGSSCKVQ